jgi:hypothetical protein
MVLVTFPERKVTRRQGGTITTAHPNNGYTHNLGRVRKTAIAAFGSSYRDRVIFRKQKKPLHKRATAFDWINA